MMRLPSTYSGGKVGATHERLGSDAAVTRVPCELHPCAERFGNAPRLRDTAARRKRPCCVEDLADRADARFVEVRYEAFEHALRAGHIGWIDFQPGVDERSHEPRPDRSLVVRGVAGAQV